MLAGQDKPPRLTGAERRAEANWEGISLQSLLKLSRGIDAFTRWLGKRLAWLILVAVIVATVNAIVRKSFDVSSNSWLELQWLLFSIVFLFCAPWTLLDNEHIRIDIISNMMKKKLRDWDRCRRSCLLPDPAVHRHDRNRRAVLHALG